MGKVMITQIRLKNCQSWDDITLDLATDRLNVIVADNDTGKSVFYKILKIVGSPKFYTKADRKELIRWGCTYAVAAFAFSSGRLGIVTISESQVIYEYIKEDGIRSPMLQPSREFLEDVGILVNPEGTFIANIIDGDQDLMLVNSNLANNFELIRMIVMSDDLDNLSEKIKMLTTEFSNYWVRVSDQRNVIDRQLKDLQRYDVEKMERELDSCERFYDSLKKLVKVWRFLGKFDRIEYKNFPLLESLLGCLEKLDDLKLFLAGLQIPKVPVDECFIKALELLENLKGNAKKLIVPKAVVDERFVDSFVYLCSVEEMLHSLAVYKADFDVLEKMLCVLDGLENINKKLKSVLLASQKIKTALQDITSLEKDFANSGTLVDCPIYGKVVFDGKECMADN